MGAATCERVDDVGAVGAHLTGERVVVEPLEHRHERDRRDRGIEIGRRGLGDAPGEHAREAGEHVVAEAAELVAADLGLGPGPDDRSVVLVEIGEAGDPRAQRRLAGRALPRAARATRPASASDRRPRPRARGTGLPCWRSRGRRCRARCARASRCRRRARRSSPSRRTPRRRRRGAGASSAAGREALGAAGHRCAPGAGRAVAFRAGREGFHRFPSRGARREGTRTRRRCHLWAPRSA